MKIVYIKSRDVIKCKTGTCSRAILIMLKHESLSLFTSVRLSAETRVVLSYILLPLLLLKGVCYHSHRYAQFVYLGYTVTSFTKKSLFAKS